MVRNGGLGPFFWIQNMKMESSVCLLGLSHKGISHPLVPIGCFFHHAVLELGGTRPSSSPFDNSPCLTYFTLNTSSILMYFYIQDYLPIGAKSGFLSQTPFNIGEHTLNRMVQRNL